jgi:hypothetical protein
MESLTVHPKNKKQLAAVKAVLKALDVDFQKEEKSPYNPDFVAMVKKAEKNGNYKTIDPNDVWGSLNLK